ncbi:MAG: T9SS type A sorting domain-containing protein [Calditrichaceae bacterium]|nr:T9SS type A sorting domain-containing protein [Calditrichia bacterium]NUQ40093.1 T9SS type A sorting domain-containing protein [Calditrichaceae bacterium]
MLQRYFFVIIALLWIWPGCFSGFAGETRKTNSTRYELGRTWYDYAPVSGRTLAHAYGSGNDGIHFVFSKVLPQGAPRRVNYDYFDEGLGGFFGNWAVTEDQATGSGRVLNGKDDEAIVGLSGSGLRIFQDSGEAGFFFSEVFNAPGVAFQGMDIHGNTVIAGGPDTLLYSLDYLQTWQGAAISPFDPSINVWIPVGPQINPANPSQVAFVAHAASADSRFPSGMYWISTADWGASWETVLIWDFDSVFATPYGASRFLDFNQAEGLYGEDGVYHAAFGAVQAIKDTSASTMTDFWPVLYWNSSDRNLQWISSPEYSAPADTATMIALQSNRPGNDFANSRPQFSRGPYPELLLCVWQQWEKDPATGEIVLLDAILGGGTVQIFATGFGCAISYDNGQNWYEARLMAGNPHQSDVFPNIAKNARPGGPIYEFELDMMYLHDTNPGVSIFQQTDPSECVWYFERAQGFLGGDAVEPFPTAPGDFDLSQNYPNPFNPATTIRYVLKRPLKILLEVFDLNGRKVVTLAEGRQLPGEHEVVFDAGKLASGVYFYRLSAGGFRQARKMVLLH